jgi:hypothetical protein
MLRSYPPGRRPGQPSARFSRFFTEQTLTSKPIYGVLMSPGILFV